MDYSGGYDIASDIFAYIDESGDEGFNTTKSTKWFVVGACIGNFNEMNDMMMTLQSHAKTTQDGRFILNSFKQMSHNNRRNKLALLKGFDYQVVISAFYKPKIDPTDPICTYPSMYFVGIKNLIERLTWLAAQNSKRKVHVLISNRNKIKFDRLQEYLFINSKGAGKNLTYFDRLGVVSISTESNHPKLLFGDYVASSMWQALEIDDAVGIPQTDYAQILLKGKFYSSNHPQYNGEWNNGIKITPAERGLIFDDSILSEGSHKV